MALIKCYECGESISDLAHACPKCGAPVSQPESSESTDKSGLTVDKKDSESSAEALGEDAATGCSGCLVVFFVIIIISFVVSFLGGDNKSKSSAEKYDSMAFIQCKNFVKDRLVSPSTADFPFLDRTTTKAGDRTYIVKSYVDSQNALGGVVRTNFTCKIRFNGGDSSRKSNWTLLSLDV